MRKNKIIALIPARGGSKGIPKKNIRLLAGQPLIAYTIKVALKNKFLDRVIVSTEDKEIAKISKQFGAEVIKRPKSLAKDSTPIQPVIEHAIDLLKRHEDYKPDIVVLLQPTSPLRTAKDINRAIEIFLKNNCKSIISVCQVGHSPYWFFKKRNKYLTPIFGWRYLRMRRQDLPKSYLPNGALFISTVKSLFKHKGFYNDQIIPYVMPPERSIDIDDEIDFQLAELIIQKHY